MPHSNGHSSFTPPPLSTTEARDLVSERLTQARGVLAALTAVPDEIIFSHSTMMASLWAVATLLEQADVALSQLEVQAPIDG